MVKDFLFIASNQGTIHLSDGWFCSLLFCVFYSGHRPLLQRLRLNSRIITILGIFCTVVGMVLMADWQSIPPDPCTNFSLYYHPELPNTLSNISMNPCSIAPSDCQWLPNGGSVHYVSALENKITTVIESFPQMPESIAHTQELHPVLNVTAYNIAMNVCESLRESQYHCHWIPKSTGTLCQACPAICRGIDHTLNFIQYTIGAFIFQSTMSVARVSIMIVISDVVSKDYQVCCLSYFSFIPLSFHWFIYCSLVANSDGTCVCFNWCFQKCYSSL